MNTATLERTKRFNAPSSAEDVRHLRHQVAKALADWNIIDRAEDVIYACSEMLTNALTYGQIEVLVIELIEHDGWLLVSVPDNNPFPPYPTTAGRDDEDGRGVFLLAALADAWGFRATDGGKNVYAEFQISGHTSPFAATMAPGSLPITL